MNADTTIVVIFFALAGLAGLAFLRIVGVYLNTYTEQYNTAREAKRLRVEFFGSKPSQDKPTWTEVE